MWRKVTEFENRIADFYGAPHAVAVDCCTHALELVLRLKKIQSISVPAHTYLSIPMTAIKLGIDYHWRDEKWQDEYSIAPDIYDSAVLWKQNSYRPNSYQCISFQFKKHLSLGRGGAILLSDHSEYEQLTRMAYDGRLPYAPWKEQVINTIGYHYYMTPETAMHGLDRLPSAISSTPVQWGWKDYPNISSYDVFKTR